MKPVVFVTRAQGERALFSLVQPDPNLPGISSPLFYAHRAAFHATLKWGGGKTIVHGVQYRVPLFASTLRRIVAELPTDLFDVRGSAVMGELLTLPVYDPLSGVQKRASPEVEAEWVQKLADAGITATPAPRKS